MTLRQAVVRYNSDRPHEWYTLDEITKAYRMYLKQNECGKQERTKLYLVTSDKHKWHNKIVRSRAVQNKDGIVSISFKKQHDHIHIKFLRSLKCPNIEVCEQQ